MAMATFKNYSDNKFNNSQFDHEMIDKQCQSFWCDLMNRPNDDNKNGVVDADVTVTKRTFTTILAPPNITNVLHLGHSLHISIQDMMVRYYKMCNRDVTWIPGVDHAGIATQVVVEKQLMKERQINRHILGRESFLEEVWKWKEKNNKAICNQIQTLCPLINYPFEQFTMSPELSTAVIDAFIT